MQEPVPFLDSDILGANVQVHQHHPPLVYGRTMGGKDAEHSVGIAACKVESGVAGGACYGVVTYECVAGLVAVGCS